MKRDEFAAMRKAYAKKPVEELLRLLASSDLRTRFIAEMSLRDAAGT